MAQDLGKKTILVNPVAERSSLRGRRAVQEVVVLYE
ncbi:MAG: hypothetical protein Greene07147_800 [Parcubacteria group bacterium Greene0714_7]|nr:MAG: hypothetical protein Greene07147_800 [Parcubacteria group bacterium Greene0714_7]